MGIFSLDPPPINLAFAAFFAFTLVPPSLEHSSLISSFSLLCRASVVAPSAPVFAPNLDFVPFLLSSFPLDLVACGSWMPLPYFSSPSFFDFSLECSRLANPSGHQIVKIVKKGWCQCVKHRVVEYM
jgi:hypothetical protein